MKGQRGLRPHEFDFLLVRHSIIVHLGFLNWHIGDWQSCEGVNTLFEVNCFDTAALPGLMTSIISLKEVMY